VLDTTWLRVGLVAGDAVGDLVEGVRAVFVQRLRRYRSGQSQDMEFTVVFSHASACDECRVGLGDMCPFPSQV
jgi:hypothetical protein